MTDCRSGKAAYNRPGSSAYRGCWDEATVTVRYACVHEHVNDVDMCEKHAAKIEAGQMFCERCWQHDDPHRCPIVGRRLDKVAGQ